MYLQLRIKGGCCASFDGKMSVQAFSSLCTHVPALPWISVHWCWKSLLAERVLDRSSEESWKLPMAVPGESAALEASLPPFTVVFVGAGEGPRQHSWAEQPQPLLSHSAKCWQQGLNFPSWLSAWLASIAQAACSNLWCCSSPWRLSSHFLATGNDISPCLWKITRFL